MSGLFSHYTGPGFVSDTQAIIIYSSVIVVFLIMVVSWWRLFTKAGEKGWKSLIPIYDFYIACKISTKKANFWIAIIAIMLDFVFNQLYVLNAGIARSLCMLVCFISTIVFIILVLILNSDMAKAFGKKPEYAIFLILLPFIAYPVLAFGSSEYKGNQFAKKK